MLSDAHRAEIERKRQAALAKRAEQQREQIERKRQAALPLFPCHYSERAVCASDIVMLLASARCSSTSAQHSGSHFIAAYQV